MEGYLCPHVNPRDTLFAEEGVCKRFGYQPPTPDPDWIAEFETFVDQWVTKNLAPLPPDADVSIDTWLASTDYPEHRKQELRDCWEHHGENNKDPKLRRCKGFVKDEFYTEFKYPRLINARHDWFKVASGPTFKLIEKELFKLDYFIKKIPVADRPQYIMEKLYVPNATYYNGDYTSFEALFVQELMVKCEMKLYKHMTQFLPTKDQFWRLLEVLLKRNKITYRDFVVFLRATRMSGEMCTSLGNGFSDLMFLLFIAYKLGATNVAAVIEGDDNLSRLDGLKEEMKPVHFAKLGLSIKLEHHTDLSEASFCGLIFDPEDLVNVTCPMKALCLVGWTQSKYAKCRGAKLKGLLRAKALSMAYQYPGCPILGHAARAFLRLTAGFDHTWTLKNYDYWQRQKDKWQKGNVPWKEPPMRTRLLVERKFGISIEDQLRCEEYFDRLDRLGPLVLPWTVDPPSDWKSFWDDYVMVVDVNNESSEAPRLYMALADYEPQHQAKHAYKNKQWKAPVGSA